MLKLDRVLLFVLMTAAAVAQPRTGTLRGVLTDDSGAVIPAASVSVNGNGGPRTSQTQADGTYTFSGLAPGQYTVHVAYPGFANVDKAVTVSAGGTVQVPIQLSIVAEKQEVTVAGESGPMVSVDPDSNVSALVLKGEDLESLPDDPDDLSDALQALAGPGAGPNGGSIYIDGFTGGQLPPKESIREIRINSNPFSPEFDRLGFGRIEILTKPGADKIRGSIGYNDSESAFNSRNPFSFGAPALNGAPGVPAKPDFSRRMIMANVGGPLNHKTSYFIDFNRRMINDNSLVNAVYLNPTSLATQPIQTAVVTPNTRNTIAPRIDYQVSKNNTLTGRMEYGWNEYDNRGISGTSLPTPYASLGYNQTGNQFNLMLTDTQIVNSHLVNETRFQYASNHTQDNGTNLLPQIGVSGSFTAGGNDMGTNYSTNHHYELQNLSTYSHGVHTIRWGVRARRNSTISESESGFGGTFRFNGEIAPNLLSNNQVVTDPNGDPMTVSLCATYPTLCSQISSTQQYGRTLLFQGMGYSAAQVQALGGMPSQFLLQSGNPYGSLAIWDAAPWVNDDWRIKSNLTLSLGLRYEWQNWVNDHRDIAPRLGFAWSPDAKKTGQGKTVIRGGFGIFYDRVNSSVFLNQLMLNGSYQLNYTVQNPLFFQSAVPAGGWAALAAAAGTPLSAGNNSIYLVDPHLRADSMLQSAIGVERQLPHNTSMSVTFTNTRGLHLLQTVPINTPDPYYGNLRPYGNAGNLFEYESGGLMRQNMLMFNVNTRATANLSLQGNYSFSTANCLESTPSDPYNFGADWGRCSFQHRNRINLVGSYLAPERIRLSPFVVMQSGSPYDITLGRDLFGDTYTNARPAVATGPGPDVISTPYGYFNTNPSLTGSFVPYDYLTQPWMFSINMRVSRTFGFGPPRNANGNNMQPGGGRPGGGFGGPGGGRGPGGGGGMRMGPMGGGGRGGFGGSDLTEHRFNLIVSVMVTNVLNHDNRAGYIGQVSSPLFGQATMTNTGFGGGPGGGGGTQANNRLVELGMRLQF
ncbi:MAG TPA: TonB-dependent receptor [Bryobacteraceae bacterium]|nr:TonB-dependent receptor [Bryobacteraceae bacterium]